MGNFVKHLQGEATAALLQGEGDCGGAGCDFCGGGRISAALQVGTTAVGTD